MTFGRAFSGGAERAVPAATRNPAEWARVLGRLKEAVGDTAFRSWFQSMRIERIDDDEECVAVPTRFLRNWIETHYTDQILTQWRAETDLLQGFRSSSGRGRRCLCRQRRHNKCGRAADVCRGVPRTGKRRLSSQHRWTALHLRNFITAKPRTGARRCRRVAACGAGATVPFNPLFLYGGVGLGKTHLMRHRLAYRTQAPACKVIYLSAEKFMYQFIRALRFRSTMDFKEQFRSVDLLMIDDVQFISGKESTQEEFFHTFNALVDQNRQIVISADKSPSDLEGLEERMRSRLGWGLVADIHPTTYELRLGILQSKAEQADVEVPQKVMEFLAHKIVSNVRERGALSTSAPTPSSSPCDHGKRAGASP